MDQPLAGQDLHVTELHVMGRGPAYIKTGLSKDLRTQENNTLSGGRDGQRLRVLLAALPENPGSQCPNQTSYNFL